MAPIHPRRALSRIQSIDGLALRDHNARFKQMVDRSVRNGIVPKARAARLIAVRKKYIARLKATVPFVRELFARQEKITIPIAGKPSTFTLLKTGIKFEGFSRPVVVILDNFGRKMLFYKSTGANSKKPGTWLPFREVQYTEVLKGRMDWWYAKFAGHPNMPEYITLLGKEIAKHEREIDFKRNWDMDQVTAINQYF